MLGLGPPAYLYVGVDDVDAALEFYERALGAEFLWHFRRFGTEVAAVQVSADGPLVLLAAHRPMPSCLPIWTVPDLDAASRTWVRPGFGPPGRTAGTPDGPVHVLRDPDGNELGFLQQDRPNALVARYADPENDAAVRGRRGVTGAQWWDGHLSDTRRGCRNGSTVGSRPGSASRWLVAPAAVALEPVTHKPEPVVRRGARHRLPRAARRHGHRAGDAAPVGLVLSVAAAGFFTALSVACPVSGHHPFGTWWFGQMACALGMLGGSVAAAWSAGSSRRSS